MALEFPEVPGLCKEAESSGSSRNRQTRRRGMSGVGTEIPCFITQAREGHQPSEEGQHPGGHGGSVQDLGLIGVRGSVIECRTPGGQRRSLGDSGDPAGV